LAGIINKNTRQYLITNADDILSLYREKVENNSCIIFDNHFINIFIENIEIQQIFVKLLKNKPRLLGFALSPNGKKIIADIMENNNIKTLAIGDGNNDIKMINRANIGVALSDSLETICDVRLKGFSYLRNLITYGYEWSQRNQLIALMTMYKSCSISFCLFWFLMLTNNTNLFDIFIQQGFHIVWSFIHPLLFSVSFRYKPINKLRQMTRSILTNNNMTILIIMSFIHSSVLIYNLHNILNNPLSNNIVAFYIIFQVNTLLLASDCNMRSLVIQMINILLYLLYIQFLVIDVYLFIFELHKFVPWIYLVTVILSHLLFRRYIFN
jgi:magnesium-transporting ATPase (P-type)